LVAATQVLAQGADTDAAQILAAELLRTKVIALKARYTSSQLRP
jgi:hypothetical protein